MWAEIAIGLSILSLIPYIGVAIDPVTLIVNSVVPNYLYYLHVKEQAQKVRNAAVDENEALQIAQHIGGVNIWGINLRRKLLHRDDPSLQGFQPIHQSILFRLTLVAAKSN